MDNFYTLVNMAENAELSTIVYNNVDNLFRYTHVIHIYVHNCGELHACNLTLFIANRMRLLPEEQ